ncbi:FUSC family protein [Legionella drancourtii]|nr:FUSC family protein [Legionella drancourtii]
MLWPRTVENRAALRTAFAALAAVLISFKLHLQTPYWSGMSVVVVSNLYTGSIIDKAVLRIIGTIAGAFVGFYVAGLVANSFLLYFLSCFLIVSIGAYYYSFSVNGYAYLLGSLCAFIIISQLALDPQNAFFVAIWRPVEIGIGVLVSAISVYFIFPNHLKDNVSEQLTALFADFSAEFKQIFATLMHEKPDFSPLIRSNLTIKKKLRKAVELVGAMNHELGVSQARTDEIRALLNSFYELSRQLHYLSIISPQHSDLKTIQSAPIAQVFQAIYDDLHRLQHVFIAQTSEPVLLQTGVAIADLEKQLGAFPSNYVYSLVHFFQHVSQSLIFIRSLLARTPITAAAKIQTLKLQDRLRTDPDLIKRSIKAGLSVILALAFWLTSNWPGGLNGIISSLIISIRKNLFEMKNISIHRLLGCFLGGGIALFALFITAMDLYDFVLVFLGSVWAFTYFMFKFPKYAYIGLQANIALIISLAQEGGPPVDLSPPLQRLGGVVIGIVASFIVANLIWRSDVWTMLNRYLEKLYTYMTYNLRQVLLVPANQKILHDLANLFWLTRGLLESLADEPLTAKKHNTLIELTARFESLVMTQATISHILVTIDHEQVRRTAIFFDCDLSLYEQNILTCFAQHDTVGGLKLSHQLLVVLSEIGDKPAFSKVKQEDLRVFLVYMNALNQLALRIH